jgi:GntR family transcriptional regulator, transcriptional repressor for pyruvate dehydrogenase complex
MPDSDIETPKLSDIIINRIRVMITSKQLLPGSKLPSEKELMKLLDVPRPQIRAAFRKLELFGITHTKPQSGTYLANYTTILLEGLLDNISLASEKFDPVSISETRAILEIHAAEYAAKRRKKHHLAKLKKANKLFTENSMYDRAVEDDVYFHLQIINASCNQALISAYLFLVPSLLNFWKSLDRISNQMEGRISQSTAEHLNIIRAIEGGDSTSSRMAMKTHLDNTYKNAITLYLKTAGKPLHK